eukprot:sb/3468895/
MIQVILLTVTVAVISAFPEERLLVKRESRLDLSKRMPGLLDREEALIDLRRKFVPGRVRRSEELGEESENGEVESDLDKRMEDEEDRGRRKGVVPGLEKREEDRRKGVVPGLEKRDEERRRGIVPGLEKRDEEDRRKSIVPGLEKREEEDAARGRKEVVPGRSKREEEKRRRVNNLDNFGKRDADEARKRRRGKEIVPGAVTAREEIDAFIDLDEDFVKRVDEIMEEEELEKVKQLQQPPNHTAI